MIARALNCADGTVEDVETFDEHPEWAGLALGNAIRLTDSKFFEPDEWISRIFKVEPVLKNIGSHIPFHVTYRLHEVYRSFVYGNWMAVFALSRSILEYPLLHRAHDIRIKKHEEFDGWRRLKGVRRLVKDTAKQRPELEQGMHDIIDAGNRIMHPHKRDKLIQYPKEVEEAAEKCMRDLKHIIEGIYVN